MSEHALNWMPLTLPQLDFWEEFACHPDEPLSTVAHTIDIRGAVDEQALSQAIEQAVRETDVLSLRFRLREDGHTPEQARDPQRQPQLRLIDLQDHANPEQAATALMQADVDAPLNLLSQPLSAQWLIKLDPSRYLWYIRAHHIVMDGFGMTLLEQRCATLYAHFLGQGEAGAPFNAFASFLDEEQSYRSSRRFEQDKAFWQDYLASSRDLTVLNKEDDFGEETLHFSCELSPALSEQLKAMAGELKMGWPDLLVNLSGLYLYRFLDQPGDSPRTSMPLWVPFMSRWGSVGAYMPALLVNILPFGVTVNPDDTLAQYLTTSGKSLRQLYSRGRYRIEQIAADQGLTANSRYFFSPFINVLPFDPPVFTGCEVKHQVITSGPADGFNITFRGRTNADALTLSLDADPLAHPREAFEQHQRRLLLFLEAVLSPGTLQLPLHALYQRVEH
ncbi:condensation domain-containing protein [Photobacterium sp. TY1-4]|uniref:condensation domain-containing protein n=1 Tax=Photobacterium sp. TY1-4 TaxID=2899122 RepID=UPI0021BFD63D|nr:condensation domain-containing protein [Photobacterium sp. TY1-4]UXI03297.1 condensation domain-containing protein [Photobacterium sp. TY1-4]